MLRHYNQRGKIREEISERKKFKLSVCLCVCVSVCLCVCVSVCLCVCGCVCVSEIPRLDILCPYVI